MKNDFFFLSILEKLSQRFSCCSTLKFSFLPAVRYSFEFFVSGESGGKNERSEYCAIFVIVPRFRRRHEVKTSVKAFGEISLNFFPSRRSFSFTGKTRLSDLIVLVKAAEHGRAFEDEAFKTRR